MYPKDNKGSLIKAEELLCLVLKWVAGRSFKTGTFKKTFKI